MSLSARRRWGDIYYLIWAYKLVVTSLAECKHGTHHSSQYKHASHTNMNVLLLNQYDKTRTVVDRSNLCINYVTVQYTPNYLVGRLPWTTACIPMDWTKSTYSIRDAQSTEKSVFYGFWSLVSVYGQKNDLWPNLRIFSRSQYST